MNKTIFITSCHSLISRNILFTGILDILTKKGIKVVIIVPQGKIEYFQKTFAREGVSIEGAKIHSKRREGIMKYLSLTALRTKTLYIKRKTEMKGSGSILSLFLNNAFMHTLIRFIEGISYTDHIFSDLFKKYSPSSVFITDIQNEIDLALLNEANKNNIYTLGMVRSWDNLTSKGLIRVVPDRLIVWNEIIKKEATTLHEIDENIISIVGIPHYDAYKSYDYSNKKAFFDKIGADINKKMILVIPIGDRYLRENNVDRDIVDILDKTLPDNYQILVRLPPGDYVRELEDNPNQFKRIKVLYDRARSTHDNIKITEIHKDDDIHLGQTLNWSDIVISGPSTVVIDAVFMNRPTILFGFDGYRKKDYFDSIKRFYDYDNFIPIIESKGARLASSESEMNELIKKYIDNPNLDQEFRKDLTDKEVKYSDGTATSHLASVLIDSFNR